MLQTHGEGFIEGNSWNFSFHVPHDVLGLINQMGGEKEFLRKLDELFGMHLPEEYYAANEDITEECIIGGYASNSLILASRRAISCATGSGMWTWSISSLTRRPC